MRFGTAMLLFALRVLAVPAVPAGMSGFIAPTPPAPGAILLVAGGVIVLIFGKLLRK
jgi:hypothetical protein